MEDATDTHRSILINNIPCTIDGFTYEPAVASDRPNMVTTSKYTLINFMPKNLFEQFRRLANFYFLVISMLQMASNSPVSPATSLVPLSFVIGVTALKQAYEDYLRHKTDDEINSRLISVIRGGADDPVQLKQVKCEEIQIGDLVSISDNQEIPVDMVLMSTGLTDGKCFVMTANLDGESNFKEKETVSVTKNSTPSQLSILQGVIQCDHPNSDLYDFTGTASIVDPNTEEVSRYTMNVRNLVMRGSKLMNSKFAYGIAVYTGHDTKLALNSKSSPNKFSSIEAAANLYLAGYLALLLFFTFLCVGTELLVQKFSRGHWYLPHVTSNFGFFDLIQTTLSYFVLLNYLIPISLYVTIEMVKFSGSNKFVHDPELIDPVTGELPKCNSSDLNEELGQVEYLFSDKTGTLTQNKMEFHSCCIGGVSYDEYQLNELEDRSFLVDFFLNILPCTSVHVQKVYVDGFETINYFADSPDEKTLVEAAARFGVQLICNNSTYCEIRIDNTTYEYKKLCVLPFDSFRKRMSVVIEKSTGEIELLTKGADVDTHKWISSGYIDEISREIDRFSRSGLRTLMIAKKSLRLREVNIFKERVYRDTFKRNKNVLFNTYKSLERNLKLIGAVAIEDKLQDGVRESISAMKKAGIKIWLLTGDKQETAVAVAKSCNLITHSMTELVISRITDEYACEQKIETLLDIVQSPDEKYVLIIDGRSLYFSMKSHLKLFRKLCQQCSVVVCCRMSPIQKADVVRMIKNDESSPITAAIGDGANDVSMIQEAHVGFGLMGIEGRQAVNSADFAFSQFRFITRVLFVHGNLFYHRVSTLIHYFFYKNIVFVIPQFLFTFYNLFTSQPLYEVVQLMNYNLAYSSLPILIYGIHEEYLPQNILLTNPTLYKKNSQNSNMDFNQMFSWFVNGTIHGCIIFYFYILLWDNSLFDDGKTLGVYDFGTSIFHAVVLVVNFKLALITNNMTKWQLFFMFISIAILPGLHLAWQSTPLSRIGIPDISVQYTLLISSASFLFSLAICVYLALLPDAVSQSIETIFKSLTMNMSFRG